jgi:hypothetical protein
MKHIKLFENFSTGDNFKAISVFPEGGSDLYVGVFPSEIAEMIYSKLNSDQYYKTEILDLPAYHNVIISELGGEGLSSTNPEELHALSGESIPSLVELGKNYEMPINDRIFFKVDKNLNKFVGVDYSGRTFAVSPEQLMDRKRNQI